MQQFDFLTKSNFTILALCVSLFFPPLFTDGNSATETYGAVPGEKLVFNVHWIGIPAGRAEMKMEKAEPGKYKLEAMVEAVGMVKFLHNVKDTLISRGDRLTNGEFQTVNYHKDQRKGKRIRQSDYQFDREKNIVSRLKKGEKPKHIKVSSKKANDPLAVFYTIRSLEKLTPGQSLVWMTVDGSKEFKMLFEVGEKIEKYTPLGWFDIIKVKVSIPASGELFRQEEAIELWLSADKRRLPIRVETKLSLGGVAADLVEYDDGRGEHKELHDDDDEEE